MKNSKRKIHHKEKSFTLMELTVVVGILLIIGVISVVVLNPVELLKQSRDYSRTNDLRLASIAMAMAKGKTSIGSPNTIYVSVPDSSPTCSDLSLPSLPSSWSYHCVPQSTLTKTDGTGWLPVNFSAPGVNYALTQLPVDPINTVSSTNYYTYTTDGSGGYKFESIPESVKYSQTAASDGGIASGAIEVGTNLNITAYTFPDYWIKVPGNSAFGTSDFWVMKYESKCVQNSNGTPLTAPDTGYNTYDDSSQACYGSDRYISSVPAGYPIANVSHNSAVLYCASMGAHLLTNDEYMTIARNAEQIASNWSGGSVGSGVLYSGRTPYQNPPHAVIASADDSQGYLGLDSGAPSTQKRTLTLSNGAVIWDFVGNVLEEVKRSTMNVGDSTSSLSVPSCSPSQAAWKWCDYASGVGRYVNGWGTSSFSFGNVGPSNSSWNTNQGVGRVYTYANQATNLSDVISRGGSAFMNQAFTTFDTTLGGTLYTLYLYDRTDIASYYTGFRCAKTTSDSVIALPSLRVIYPIEYNANNNDFYGNCSVSPYDGNIHFNARWINTTGLPVRVELYNAGGSLITSVQNIPATTSNYLISPGYLGSQTWVYVKVSTMNGAYSDQSGQQFTIGPSVGCGGG